MIIVALTDLHDDIAGLKKISDELSAADVVLLTGDLTNFGHEEKAQRVVQAVRKYNARVLAVSGNCDFPGVETYLMDEGINLHRRSVIIKGVTFIGIGGSLPAPIETPNVFSDNELAGFLNEITANVNLDIPMILVSHQPPYNTVADLASNGQHVGSHSIRAFIEKCQPIICFTGHIHEGQGIDLIGKTAVINPGPFGQGGYSYADIDQEVKVLEIRYSYIQLPGGNRENS